MTGEEQVREVFALLGKVEKRLVEEMQEDWNGYHHDTFGDCLSLIRTSREALAGLLEPEHVGEAEAVRHAADDVFELPSWLRQTALGYEIKDRL